jgi:hypothetical protein
MIKPDTHRSARTEQPTLCAYMPRLGARTAAELMNPEDPDEFPQFLVPAMSGLRIMPEFRELFPTSLSSWPCRLRSQSKWRKEGAPPSVPIGSRGAYEFRTKTQLQENDLRRECA